MTFFLSRIGLTTVFSRRIYNKFGRTYLFDVDFYHLKKDEDDPPKYCIDAYHAGNVSLRNQINEIVH